MVHIFDSLPLYLACIIYSMMLKLNIIRQTFARLLSAIGHSFISSPALQHSVLNILVFSFHTEIPQKFYEKLFI